MLPSFRGVNRTFVVRSFMAVASGVSAKALGLFNQVVSVTLISNALGAEGLQEQMLAIASVSWFSLTFCGMHTALPFLLIRSGTNTKGFASIAKTAYLFAVIGASSAVGVTILVLKLGIAGDLAAAPVATAAICNAAALVLSLSEKIFQATDRIAQFNVLNVVGTLISLASTIFLARTHGTAADFVMAFYLGMFFPFLVATFVIVPHLNLMVIPSMSEFSSSARRLIGVGVFGFGYEIAAYCKLQAPLALLGTLNFADQIAPVGLGLRLIALISGSLSIVIPILFLRIGAAIHVHDREARRLWTHLGIACASAVAVGVALMFLIFGEIIYQTWTGGVVTLDRTQQVALAAFSALALAQNLLFPLVAPDHAITEKLRWLFWLEGPAVIAASAVGAIAVPSHYAGAGMLAGATIVIGVSIAILLLALLMRSRSFKTPAGA